MSDTRRFVIVGAGQAGRWLALTLRASGYAGRIVWFGEESARPYERPPLSKAVLKGDVGLAQLALLAEDKFAELNVDWRPGARVAAIDRAARCVETANGERLNYDALFLATGGRARGLPGLAAHARICSLRSYEDALALKRGLAEAGRIIVIGGGWIGLEVAASARGLGKNVTVIEAAPRLCVRTVPPVVSEYLRGLHEGRGVEVRLGCAVSRVAPDDTGVSVELAGGEVLRADLLVLGIGLVPNDGLAAASGLATDNGVLTDAWGRTSDPAVYAVGDVANALRANGQRTRLESWENAQRQAVAAAQAALGLAHDPEAEGPGWFWSDQYDDNLQVLGEPGAGMEVVERSDPARRQRIFFFCEGSRIRAVAAVNAGREVKLVRKWMREGRNPAPADLADTRTELNKLPLAAAVC